MAVLYNKNKVLWGEKENTMDRRKICMGALVGLCVSGFLWWQDKAVEVSEHVLWHDKIGNTFDGFTILQVSDLQSNRFGRKQRRLIEKARETHPDIIVITGDLIDRNHTDYLLAYQAVKGLSEIAPVFYVNGNHELLLDQKEYGEFLDKIDGITAILNGSSVLIESDLDEDGILFAGLDENVTMDARGWNRKNVNYDGGMISHEVKRLFSDGDDRYRVLLAHEPQFIDEYAEGNPDLVLSGHAHGGQVRLPYIGGIYSPEQGLFPKYSEGMHQLEHTKMIVSRGLGNSRFPFRIFNRPELVRIVLKKG